MAIIKCPECGKDTSDHALSCPNCGYPINNATEPKNTQQIEKYLDLAIKAIQGKDSTQVEQYCQQALLIDPCNSKAWELEARGLLFHSTLKENKISQAIGAAANAVTYTTENKEQLAESLYDSIVPTINGLLNIATGMPVLYAPQYVSQCMLYYGELLCGIPNLPKRKIESELSNITQMDNNSKRAFLPKSRLIYASRVGEPNWGDQFRDQLRRKGVI